MSLALRIHQFKHLTPRKLWNGMLLTLSYYLSRWLGKALHSGRVFTLNIEPTTACNLRCPECPSGLRSFSRPTGNMDHKLFEKIVNENKRHLWGMNFYFQGEPFIHPGLLEMVKFASDAGIYCSTSTNGHFMDAKKAEDTVKSGLDHIIFSIDGTTQEVYQQYRREGDLQKVFNGLDHLIEAKQRLKSATPFISVQFLVVGPNEHQIESIKKICEEKNVDRLLLKTAQIYHYQSGSPLIPEQEVYSRYVRQNDGSYRLKYRLLNQCWKMWHSAVICWDGRWVPCCFDKDAEYEMGHLNSESSQSIWKSKEYQNFRRQILVGREQIDICSNCSEGCEVWA